LNQKAYFFFLIFHLKEIEYALIELSCEREKCLVTFIDCNIKWKRVSRLENKLKEQAEMAQLKEEANQKMAVENEKLLAENQNMAVEYTKMAAENEELRTRNEELTKANRQLQKADDEITQNVCFK
jgi:hypothetical protein